MRCAGNLTVTRVPWKVYELFLCTKKRKEVTKIVSHNEYIVVTLTSIFLIHVIIIITQLDIFKPVNLTEWLPEVSQFFILQSVLSMTFMMMLMINNIELSELIHMKLLEVLIARSCYWTVMMEWVLSVAQTSQEVKTVVLYLAYGLVFWVWISASKCCGLETPHPLAVNTSMALTCLSLRSKIPWYKNWSPC